MNNISLDSLITSYSRQVPKQDYRKLIKELLYKHKSWLYDEMYVTGGINFRSIFDLYSNEYNSSLATKKMIMLREMFDCGFTPLIITYIYKEYCKECNIDKNQYSLEAVLGILEALTFKDLGLLDNNDPSLWYKEHGFRSKDLTSHEVIINGLKNSSYKQIKNIAKEPDSKMRKRSFYFINDNAEYHIVKNNNSTIDKLDDELLLRLESIKKGDNISVFVDEIYKELDSEHKKESIDALNSINKAIKENNLESIKELPAFNLDKRKKINSIQEVHEIIIDSLKTIDEEKFNQIKKTKSIKKRKLLLLFNNENDIKMYSKGKNLCYLNMNNNILCIPNNNPVLDKVDEELLKRIDELDEYIMARVSSDQVELLSEKILDEIDENHRRERHELAICIYNAIENIDLDTLNTIPLFQNKRIEHFVDNSISPKEWLYAQIEEPALKRDLRYLRKRNNNN